MSAEQLTSETLENHLLYGDYPQHSVIHVLDTLVAVFDLQLYTEEQFFEKVQIGRIKTFSEYITHYCSRYNLKPPQQLSQSLREKAHKIDKLVEELRDSLNEKSDLTLIYAILLKFKTQLGFTFDEVKTGDLAKMTTLDCHLCPAPHFNNCLACEHCCDACDNYKPQCTC